jgi:hypothetical protein
VVFVAREVVFVVTREVVEPIAVVEPGVAENFMAPGIEIDGSSEGIELVDVHILVIERRRQDKIIRRCMTASIEGMLITVETDSEG